MNDTFKQSMAHSGLSAFTSFLCQSFVLINIHEFKVREFIRADFVFQCMTLQTGGLKIWEVK